MSSVPPPGNPDARGWLRRRHYVLLATVFIGIAAYGSLVPFRFQPLELHEAVERFRQVPRRSLAVGGRADLVANVLLFVPIGYCWLGVFLLDRRLSVGTALAPLLVALLAGALSIALEFSQLWFPPRVASGKDLLAQAAGTVLGMGLWLAVGQTITDWVRSWTVSTHRTRWGDWFLQAYLAGLVIYSLQPFDLTISVTDLVHKYREGRITLVPVLGTGTGTAWLFFGGLLCHAALFIPVGMLAASWLTPAKRPVRSLGASLILGTLVVVAIELAQLLVYSCPSAAGDVITGMVGVGAGACLMRRWRGRGQPDELPSGGSGPARRAWGWLGLAGVYSLLLAILLCTPFELVDDLQQAKARYEGFFGVPFAGLSRGSHLDALLDALKKVLLFAPLGGLFALAVAPLSVPRPVRRIVLAGLLLVVAGIGTAIEMAQSLLMPHVPDVTDVILYTAGAAMGMLLITPAARRQAKGSFTPT
jgi:glycopeptide antibiotics resistance protein